jgi:hypothetical protein
MFQGEKKKRKAVHLFQKGNCDVKGSSEFQDSKLQREILGTDVFAS